MQKFKTSLKKINDSWFVSSGLYSLFMLIVFPIFINAQSHDPKINSHEPDLPNWVQMMYSDNPNVWQVEQAFITYYQSQPFEKNTYTQYYKRWMQRVKAHTNKEGYVQYPSPEQIVNMEAKARQFNDKTMLTKTTGASWEFIGPDEVFTLKNDVSGPIHQVSWHANVYGVDIALANPNSGQHQLFYKFCRMY